MSTLQLGSRLVRPLSNGKKAITEVIDGKHYIKILNKDGDVLNQRVKKFDTAAVGDKFVKTRTQVEQYGGCTIPKKEVYHRVYDNDKNLVAAKKILTSLDGVDGTKFEYVITKAGDVFDTVSNSTGRFTRTSGFPDNGIGVGTSKLGRVGVKSSLSPDVTVHYSKGLPMPKNPTRREIDALKDMSLAQRRAYWQDKHPDLSYTDVPSLQSLNDKVAGTKLNNLDELL